MRIVGSKVPFALVLAAGLAVGGCGGEAESASDEESVRVIPSGPGDSEDVGPPELRDASEVAGSDPAPEVSAPAPTPDATPPSVVPSEPTSDARPARGQPRPYRPDPVRTDPEPDPVPDTRLSEPTEEAPLAVPAGSTLELRMETALSTRFNRAGEIYHATLLEDVLGPAGVVLLPAGARVTGRIVSARESEGADKPAVLALGVESVTIDGRVLPVVGRVVDVELKADTRDSGTETAVKVGAGAAAGAILGKVIGKDNKDALKGAAAGAVAGTAVALATRGGHATIDEGARIVVQLDERLIVDR